MYYKENLNTLVKYHTRGQYQFELSHNKGYSYFASDISYTNIILYITLRTCENGHVLREIWRVWFNPSLGQ